MESTVTANGAAHSDDQSIERHDKMTKDDVISTVCEVCGITPEELQKRSRKEPLPFARALTAHFLYKELNMFPREILPLIGYPGCSRTAIYHYLGRETLVERQSPYQKEMREKSEQVQRLLNLKKQDLQ